MKTEEEDSDDGYWTVNDTVAETTKNALLIRVIDRRCGQMCARTDLAFRMKPGSEWDKKREARAALKNHINNTQKKVNGNSACSHIFHPLFKLKFSYEFM